MALSLKNKTVVITGATDGLGKILAKSLAEQGANVVVHGRSSEKAEQVVSELKELNNSGKYSALVCDLNKPETVYSAFEKLDKVDILINNAGVWEEGDTAAAKPEKIIELVNVNLLSYLLATRALLPKLQQSDFAQILNVVSVAGYEVPKDYAHTYYSATKYALQGFSEGMAKEFEGKKLRVMGYYPGGMATALFKKAGNDYKENEPWMFDPRESAEAILFMLTRNEKVNIKRMDLINHLFE